MLAQAMIAHATTAAEALRDVRQLETLANALVARARAAWPRIVISEGEFVAHVARQLDGSELHTATDVAETLEALHADDLWLAFAAGGGDSQALTELDRLLVPMTEMAVARMKDRVSADEIAQRLRERLFVPRDGRRGKILDYAGRGPLRGWLRVAATRLALDQMKTAAAQQSDDGLLELATSTTPEIEHLRERYAQDFRAAFEAALAELSPEQRNILRLSLVDRLSIDEIGVVFDVHRATAARQLVRARDTIAERTLQILGERLRVDSVDLNSIVALVRSRLDLSIHRLLTEDAVLEPKAGESTRKGDVGASPTDARRSKKDRSG